MITLFLKTDSEKDLITVLSQYGFYDTDNNKWLNCIFIDDKRVDLDLIGAIYRTNGLFDDSFTPPLPLHEELPGYHANLLWPDNLAVPEDILAISIEPPSTPQRIFFV